jgi:fumarylacetoacetase
MQFSINNIPFAVLDYQGQTIICSAYGDRAINLKVCAEAGIFNEGPLESVAKEVFAKDTLNAFMALGRGAWQNARKSLQSAIRKGSIPQGAWIHLDKAQYRLPCSIGDYTDFYASKEHATNVGTMFRGKDNALQPNWVHLPVGYHGRASSVVVSGTPIVRPAGQLKPPEGAPVFGLSTKLDFELEMAFIVGVGNELGRPIAIDKADEHIFGAVLMNDWSARDIQAWEYVPLGPFLGKSFGTTISPWIVTIDALKECGAVCDGPKLDAPVLPYLQQREPRAFSVDLSVRVNKQVVCRSNMKYLYWSLAQMLAHHTINGCNMRTGDLCGTGTISGPTADSLGSMLELSWNGTKSVVLDDGPRRFLEDYDEVLIAGSLGSLDADNYIDFGECIGTIHPNPISLYPHKDL